MSARGKNSRGHTCVDLPLETAPATEMPAIYGLPSGQFGSAGGDGQFLHDVPPGIAIPKKARKGARRAKVPAISVVVMPDAKDIGLVPHDIHPDHANSGIDQYEHVAHLTVVDPAVIAAIQSLHREHRAIQRARGDMDRRIKADERWFAVRRLRAAGEPLPPGKFPDVTAADEQMVIATRQRFFTIRDAIEAQRKECQKELLKLVKPLPVMAWVAGVKGLGLPSVAAIIGEAGDLSNYANPGKLWKRMGLAVIDGKGQGKRSNAEEALRHGYSPARRSEMHVVGDCLVRAGGPYAGMYRERKSYEAEKEGITKMWAHKRALRYIEKRLLRSMWSAWRGAEDALCPVVGMPPADELAGQGSGEIHSPIASQDGNHTGGEIHSRLVPVQSIPRKRVPRATGTMIPMGGMPVAAE